VAPTVLVIDDSPTILKVVQLVLSKAGFRVVTAADGEGGLDVARAERPDLVLLDFVMPKMNGYQVCRALAAEDALRDIPVVLMSAKGDQVGERFVKVMGIVDYITKPFSPEAITAVAQHTIAKYQGKAAPERPIAGAGATAAEDDDPATDPLTIQTLDHIRRRLAGAVGGRIAALHQLASAARQGEASAADASGGQAPDFVPTDADAVADAARSALTDATLLEILKEAAPLYAASAEPGSSLRGDLRVVPIAEVLQLLDAQKQSGVLSVSRTGSAAEVHFRAGRIELALAKGIPEELLLGRFVVESELMSRADLDGFLASRAPGTKLIGQQLVKLGYLSEAGLKTALARQTREIVYEILRWSFGGFHFTRSRDLPAIAADAALGLDVEGILMEGFRRVDEWHLIEREVDDFDTVFLRNEDAVAQMGRGRLTREELAVLELVNGKSSVKEIIRTSRMGSFDVSKMLYRLLSIKLIRRRVSPVAV
jgi:CheY-like chemotaxis protein